MLQQRSWSSKNILFLFYISFVNMQKEKKEKEKSFKCIILKNFRKKRNHLLCACKISQDWALHHFYFWVCTVNPALWELLANCKETVQKPLLWLTFKFGSLTCGLIYSQLCTIYSEHRSTTCKAKRTTG